MTIDNTPSWGCFVTPTFMGFVSPKTLKFAATDVSQETLKSLLLEVLLLYVLGTWRWS